MNVLTNFFEEYNPQIMQQFYVKVVFLLCRIEFSMNNFFMNNFQKYQGCSRLNFLKSCNSIDLLKEKYPTEKEKDSYLCFFASH